MAGVAVLTVLVPANAIGSKIAEVLQKHQLKSKDSRIKVSIEIKKTSHMLKLMNEILAGIKVLKLYAWEIPFMKRILATRNQEIQYIKKNGILNAFTNFTFSFLLKLQENISMRICN
jgi:hypothetical protein